MVLEIAKLLLKGFWSLVNPFKEGWWKERVLTAWSSLISFFNIQVIADKVHFLNIESEPSSLLSNTLIIFQIMVCVFTCYGIVKRANKDETLDKKPKNKD